MATGQTKVARTLTIASSLLLGAALCALVPAGTAAQQITGTPGSPTATVTVNGSQLPAPPQKFGGKIGRNAAQSTPYWPARIEPPKGAPNILLIMTDDVGFGAPSTFGGVIPTPALDYVAQNGLRYTNFHSTALCSPTRAALLTGRNHHSVGFGVISEGATGYPGYDTIIPKNKATIGTILKDNGYVTAWFGKDHNTPAFQTSVAGPFDQWPTGMGFDYFYGFVGGDTNQWEPGNLYRDTTLIHPYVGHPGWNLTTAEADDAISYMKRLDEVAPREKWFIYYAPGGTHAPHDPTPEWVSKVTAMHLFDKGWNALRQQIFENQKKLGVIPQNAKLTPWPDKLFQRWDQLTPDQKKLYIRQANVYAAYLAYTDHEIGRVIDEVKREGKLDNTLIIYISGDNGSSAEGGLDGTPNEVALFNGVRLPVKAQLAHFYDAWGTDQTYAHMAAPWAWAFDTPFSWTKQVASHFGGTKQGMAMSWPAAIKDRGGVRWQFHHVIDIVPTILQVTGIKAPDYVNGIKQAPIEGVSMAYTFPKADADVPSHHHTQYFEMMGDHAIYHDGWIASTKVMRPPWALLTKVNADPANYPWELYDLKDDWTQYDDVAAKYPKKLAAMEQLFWKEAQKYQVLPLDATVGSRMIVPKPSITAGRSVFTYSGELTGVQMSDAPNILDASYSIKAEIEIPKDGAEGVIVTEGGRFGGYGFYLLKNKPVFLWNLLNFKRVRWESDKPLSPGMHTLEFEFKYDGLGMGTLAFNDLSGIGRGGTGTLKVDGAVVSTQQMAQTLPLTVSWEESFDVGADTGTPVDDQDYQVPFRFTGKLDKLTITIDRPKLSPADIAKLKAAQGDGNPMSE
ncbi:MAG: arylsulfatase [Alphaproteobacteria bacterium]|nr:arylsulfatase [Alphaproteobacteria bacterium]MDE2011812.1 arylsulfatase [Alphaproteobacteria bacterium]